MAAADGTGPAMQMEDDEAARTSPTRANSSTPSGTYYDSSKHHHVIEQSDLKRSDKTLVQVWVVFAKIGEINTLKQRYSADISIYLKWREPSLDGQTMDQLKKVDFENLWSPCLYIENFIVEQKDTSCKTAILSSKDDNSVYILERRQLKGVFFEKLELENYPFDVQDLSVTVASERTVFEVELVADKDEQSSVNVATFTNEQEWKLYQHVDVAKKTLITEVANQKRKHSAFQATCQAARRPGFFYYNVFLIMFFITSLSFGVFAVDCRLPEQRNRLSFTLLLTTITFKMVISQTLPKISYLTYMDKYVLMSLVFLVLVCIWHSIVPKICSVDNNITKQTSFFKNHEENFVILSFAVIYLVGHILFFVVVYNNAWKRRREIAKKARHEKPNNRKYSIVY